jgi:hypothetical protein
MMTSRRYLGRRRMTLSKDLASKAFCRTARITDSKRKGNCHLLEEEERR